VSGALPTVTAESVETHRETEAFVHERWQATLTVDGQTTRQARTRTSAWTTVGGGPVPWAPDLPSVLPNWANLRWS